MQVQVITGAQASGKTTRLRAIQAELKQQGIEAPILVGEQCTTPYFVNQIAARAMAGDKQFLADDCTQFQIKAAMDLEAQGIHSGIPSDFVVHLVRQA
ncbi:UNVERIFIED_ORG: molybdopterin-guanine dinucleotide biosynthesis protein [Pseudomonas fluorescens]|jgi:molybdopterin-guanine dinucleotide biosynthesis protein|nr:molybdopterin-guanine dinucleotide biosynthesis protein [Pseudomonas fluorescens]